MVDLQQKPPAEENLSNSREQQDIFNFGAVLFALAELNEFPVILNNKLGDQISPISPFSFNKLHDGPAQRIIRSLLEKDPTLRPNAEQLLANQYIQDRITSWRQTSNSNSQSNPIVSPQEQFSIYRTYFSQLLVDIAGSSNDAKLALAKNDVFVEFVNILRWASVQNNQLARPLQEWICVATILLTEDQQEAANIAHETEIIQELHVLIGTILSLDEVKFVHGKALNILAHLGGFPQKKKMFEMGIAQSIVKHIKSIECDVVEKILLSIMNMFIFKQSFFKGRDKHPYLSECQRN
ncbi:MAG: hypothetical protein EZS28_048937, partial [Streblomastix strix]